MTMISILSAQIDEALDQLEDLGFGAVQFGTVSRALSLVVESLMIPLRES